MNPKHNNARQALLHAWKASKSGDNRSARRWAERAAVLAPDWEEPWLMLASFASPKARVAYIREALKINPQNERARTEIIKAEATLQQITKSNIHSDATSGSGSTQPRKLGSATKIPPQEIGRRSAPTPSSNTQETRSRHTAIASVRKPGIQQDSANILGRSSVVIRRHVVFPLFLSIVCISAVWALWPGNAAPVLAYLRSNIQNSQAQLSQAGAAVDIAKPTYTSSPTPTFTPTQTSTPSPTPTNTATSTSTSTLLPTQIATSTSQPSSPDQPTNPGIITQRWIDVDISSQRLYAYEGDNLIAVFIVSTGTWQYPTVIGQYNIYIKLRYTDMSGPGYYLPNVPFTMYFYKGYAIHGTYWHSNFGTQMSHGCINMTIADAGWLYDFASVGTLVNIHY